MMQKLLFSGLLGSDDPEAIPKFYLRHPQTTHEKAHFIQS